MNSSVLFSTVTFSRSCSIAFTPTHSRGPSLLIPPPLSRRFEKSMTPARSRLSWKAKSNPIFVIPSKVEESRDAADPYRLGIVQLRWGPLTITTLRQLLEQFLPAGPSFIARFSVGFANGGIGWFAQTHETV